MRDAAQRLILGCAAALVVVSGVPSLARAEKVPCYQVVAELNHRISRNMDRDPKKIAKRLDTEPDWVEECLRLHGRRVSAPRRPTEIDDPTPGPFDPNQLEDPFFPFE